jgi:hypothetical protein
LNEFVPWPLSLLEDQKGDIEGTAWNLFGIPFHATIHAPGRNGHVWKEAVRRMVNVA